MSEISKRKTQTEGELFFAEARAYLEEVNFTRNVLPKAVSLEPKWHPNGFIVYHLSELEIGNLRLHIWPSSRRELRLGAPSAHSHPWHLASRVLSGTYREVLYRENPEEDRRDRGVRVDLIDYGTNPDHFSATDTIYVNPSPEQFFATGQYHFIEAGILHKTSIPIDTFGQCHSVEATLLVSEGLVDGAQDVDGC